MASGKDPLVVVVTGASSGIGRAVALRFAREKANVALAARNEKALADVARDVGTLGGSALVAPTDVSKWDSVQQLAHAVEARWGRADVVVNAAGIGLWGPVAELSVEDFDAQVAVNLRGPFLVSKAFLPLMLGRGGNRAIVNVASVSGLNGTAGLAGYCASKFGLRGLTQSLAAEVSDDGIRVFAVNPGYVATPMVEDAGAPMKDMIQPEEIADFLWQCVHAPPSIQIEDLTLWPQKMYSQ